MNQYLIYGLGIITLPVLFAVWVAVQLGYTQIRGWITHPNPLGAKDLPKRQSLITFMTLELLDARYVRGVRIPFGRMVIIRSNPRREYDMVTPRNSVLVGDDYDNTRHLVGKMLSELGYELPPSLDVY